MAVQILIDPMELFINTLKMEKLARKVENRALLVSMIESRGEFAEGIQETASALYETGQVFAEIARKTTAVLREACNEFIQADKKAASGFGG